MERDYSSSHSMDTRFPPTHDPQVDMGFSPTHDNSHLPPPIPERSLARETQMKVNDPEPHRASFANSEHSWRLAASSVSFRQSSQIDNPFADIFGDPDYIRYKRIWRERQAQLLSGEKEEVLVYDEDTLRKENRWHTLSKAKELFHTLGDEEFENPFLSSASEQSGLLDEDVSPGTTTLCSAIDMDVDALVADYQTTEHQFVDNDHLRGETSFNFDPHFFRPSCGCYHCKRYRYGLDKDEPHNVKYCPCRACFDVRKKVEVAERERDDNCKSRAMKKVKTKRKLAVEVGDMDSDMRDELEDEENVVDAGAKAFSNRIFDMITRGLRSPS
ncbi:hypothetical protein EG329_001500 [Mollisiaceae sp. DMI_Dod_QoI]|nr:hypothetical protein EG329_001500 [Helotiales sp. DMI_Dod_QoI]